MLPGLCLLPDLEEEGSDCPIKRRGEPREREGVGMLRPRRVVVSRSDARRGEAGQGGGP